jgi:hypothetical protein
MNAPSFYAAESISCKDRYKDRLQDIHNGMMSDPIREIRKPEHFSFFRFVNLECVYAEVVYVLFSSIS